MIEINKLIVFIFKTIKLLKIFFNLLFFDIIFCIIVNENNFELLFSFIYK